MKFNKLSFCAIIILASSVLFASPAISGTYYIKSDGDDNLDGQSWDTAWKTIKKINRFNPVSGSYTFYFRPGDTFSDATLTLGSWQGNYSEITFESINGGRRTLAIHGKAKINVNTSSKVAISLVKDWYSWTINKLTIKNLNCDNISSYSASINKQVYVCNIPTVIIDGVNIDGHAGGATGDRNGIQIREATTRVEVKNCIITNCGPAKIPTLIPISKGGDDTNGISIYFRSHAGNGPHNTVSIHNNTVYNINADAILVAGFMGSRCEINNNMIYNFGENALDYQGSRNLDFHHNEVYDAIGDGGTGGSCTMSLWYAAHLYPSLSENSINLTIRDNHFHDDDSDGIILLGHTDKLEVSNVSIYGNLFEDMNGMNIVASRVDGLNVDNNRFISSSNSKSCTTCNCSIIHIQYYSSKDIDITDNTILVEAGDITRLYGIALQEGSGQTIDDVTLIGNTIMMARNDSEVYSLATFGGISNLKIDENTYQGTSSNRILYDGVSWNDSQFGHEAGHWNDIAGKHPNDIEEQYTNDKSQNVRIGQLLTIPEAPSHLTIMIP